MTTPMERSELEDLYTEEAQLQRQLGNIPAGRAIEGIGLRHRLRQVGSRIAQLQRRTADEAQMGWEAEKRKLRQMLLPAVREETADLLLELAEGTKEGLAPGDLQQAGEALRIIGYWAVTQGEAQREDIPEAKRQDGRETEQPQQPGTTRRRPLPKPEENPDYNRQLPKGDTIHRPGLAHELIRNQRQPGRLAHTDAVRLKRLPRTHRPGIHRTGPGGTGLSRRWRPRERGGPSPSPEPQTQPTGRVKTNPR